MLTLNATGARAVELPAAATADPTIVVTADSPNSRTVLSTAVTSLPASVTVLGAKQISQTAVASYGDLFRPVAGVDVSNFGQGGIGYGVAMRGYTDAEHGRDVGFVIDGVPINEVSSLQAPGYADLNVLIPETVDHIDIVRGPFDIQHGDNSVGGTINIVTKTSQPFSSLSASGGSYATFRGVGILSLPAFSTLQVTPLIGLELANDGGYRNNSRFRHLNLFNKFTLPVGGGQLSLRVHVYDGEFGSPGYLNRDDIVAGRLSDRAATNPTDGGYKRQQDFVGHYTSGAPASAFDATAFVSHDTFSRSADFGGGQSTGQEHRLTSGSTLRKVFTPSIDGIPVQLLIGADVRADQVDARRFPSTARVAGGPDRLNIHYDETRVGGYGQLQVKPADWLKLTAGSRYDRIYYDVRDRLTQSASLTTDTGVFSPKVGISATPIAGVEFYGNYGEGFRSPSVVDEIVNNPALAPLKTRSEEGGARFTFIPRLTLAVDAWRSTISNEAFQPAVDLPLQNLGRSRRQGIDVETRFAVVATDTMNVGLIANLGTVDARLIGQGIAQYVPNVPKYVSQLGVDFDLALAGEQRLDGSLRVDLIGRKNLSADGLQRTRPYQRISGKINYSPTAMWTGFAQGMLYAGDRLSEAAFNFGDAVGAASSDIFVSAQPRFAFQIGITRRFNTGA